QSPARRAGIHTEHVCLPRLGLFSGMDYLKFITEGGRASLPLVSDLPWGLQSLAVAIFACTLRELPQYTTKINEY
ncbi:mCG1029487, partial [Mus musculus]